MPTEYIAVIADTHDTLPKGFIEKVKDAHEIWHLGDVCSPQTLKPLDSLNAKLLVVAGNCDPRYIWPDQLDVTKHGRRFRLQHLPPDDIPMGDFDAILHGHLHKPIDDDRQGTRVLNPGAISGPRHGSAASFAWLSIAPDGAWNWELETL